MALFFLCTFFDARESDVDATFAIKKKIEPTVTYSREVALKNPEAQASITVYLFSFNSGRVARRSGPLFLCPFQDACAARLRASSIKREISAVLSNPMTAACWGMMLSALNPGTALTSMT